MEMRRLHALVCLVSDCWKTRHVVGDSVTSSDCWDYAMTSSRREVDQVTKCVGLCNVAHIYYSLLYWYRYTHTHTRLMALFPGLPG